MGLLSKTLRSVEGGGLAFWCPGCNGAHQVHVGDGPGPRWGYNGAPEKPTFTPSVLVRTIRPDLTDAEWAEYDQVAEGPGGTERVLSDPRFQWVCHSFVTDGRIQFLGDCSHHLAGQTVDLPAWPGQGV